MKLNNQRLKLIEPHDLKGNTDLNNPVCFDLYDNQNPEGQRMLQCILATGLVWIFVNKIGRYRF